MATVHTHHHRQSSYGTRAPSPYRGREPTRSHSPYVARAPSPYVARAPSPYHNQGYNNGHSQAREPSRSRQPSPNDQRGRHSRQSSPYMTREPSHDHSRQPSPYQGRERRSSYAAPDTSPYHHHREPSPYRHHRDPSPYGHGLPSSAPAYPMTMPGYATTAQTHAQAPAIVYPAYLTAPPTASQIAGPPPGASHFPTILHRRAHSPRARTQSPRPHSRKPKNRIQFVRPAAAAAAAPRAHAAPATHVTHGPARPMGVSDSGAAQAQGSRPYQEDAYVIGPPARYAKASSSSHSGRTQAFFAVYDGHGGKFASAHAARGLHPLLIQSRSFAKGRYEEALREAFAREDAELATHARATNCGCTAVVALVDMNAQKLIVANAGDSRAVLGVQQPAPNGQGVYVRAVRMSVDHQPTIPEEKARIEGLGGFITHDGRVGTLAVSRSLGDHSYKLHANEPPSDAYIVALRPGATPAGDLVSSLPHIASAPLSEHTPFLVIGSDGLFGVLKDQEVVDSVAHLMAARWPAKVIAKHLVEAAVARWGEGAADNVTAVVVIFG